MPRWILSAFALSALAAPFACGEGSTKNTQLFSVVSQGGFLAVPPPACEGEGPIESRCDDQIPLNCSDLGRHIDFDPDDDTPCPVCMEASSSDPTTCEGWQERYGQFLADNISQSCVNWCDGDQFRCSASEITNACGTFAVALSGNLDEETIEFAREFAEENCTDVCGEVPQTEGALSTLQGLEAACRDNQCVLVPEEDDEEEPLPDPDAAPRSVVHYLSRVPLGPR